MSSNSPFERRSSADDGVIRPGPGAPVGGAVVRSDTRTVFGQTMFLVAITTGFTALGAYVGRDISGGLSLGLWLVAFVAILGMSFARKGIRRFGRAGGVQIERDDRCAVFREQLRRRPANSAP